MTEPTYQWLIDPQLMTITRAWVDVKDPAALAALLGEADLLKELGAEEFMDEITDTPDFGDGKRTCYRSDPEGDGTGYAFYLNVVTKNGTEENEGEDEESEAQLFHGRMLVLGYEDDHELLDFMVSFLVQAENPHDSKVDDSKETADLYRWDEETAHGILIDRNKGLAPLAVLHDFALLDDVELARFLRDRRNRGATGNE